MKRSVLILAKRDDPHANTVGRRIEALGGNVTLLDTQDISSLAMASFRLDGNRIQGIGNLEGLFQSIWLRRPISAPWREFSELSPTPHEIEQKQHRDALIEALSETAMLCANKLPASLRAESKLVALSAARKCGFSTPRTLYGACPLAIKQFWMELDGRVVYKPHRPHAVGYGKFLGTVLVTEDHITKISQTNSAPGVYQELIDVRIELRVLVAGREAAAIQLPQRDGTIDSRMALESGPITAYVLPRKLRDQCIELIRELGLVSASMDLLLTSNGEVFAIDVNPSGQFGWMERRCPEVQVINLFSRFLMSGEVDFEISAN